MSNRRTGKIARLPFEVRTALNVMMRDGKPYAKIIAWLKDEHNTTVLDQNLTNWREGGHADWLKEQDRLAEMQAKREFAMQIVKENDGSKLHEANLHLAASQIYEVLSEFDPQRLKDLLDESPENYAHVVNALGKLSKSNIEVQKYKDAVNAALKICADAKRGDDKGGLSADTIERIERELKLL